jgi:ketosteroid isomerase-like protein
VPDDTTPNLLELNRRMIEADTFDEWAMLAQQLYAPNAVWNTMGHMGRLTGRNAIVAFVRDYWLMWDDHHHYIEENADLGHGVIWGVIREHGRIKGSEAYVEARKAWVSLWDEGRCVRVTTYLDVDEARAAAERLAESTNPNLVERVSAFFEAANRRDIEARMSFLARDAVWDLSPMGMGTFEGRAAIRRFLEDWRSSFDEVWWTLEKVVDLGNGVVLAVTRQDALLADGGAPLREMWVYVLTWVEGMVARVIPYNHLDEARAAAERLARERG